MSSFFDISRETEAILNTTGSSMQPASIERLWELISWWCASQRSPMLAHFSTIILEKLFKECHERIFNHVEEISKEWMQLREQLRQNIQQPQQNIQQPQRNIQHNQQLDQDPPQPGGNETLHLTQQRLRLSQGCWQRFQELWQRKQQQGRGSLQEQKELLLILQVRQLQETKRQLQHELRQLQQRLQWERQQLEGGRGMGERWNRQQPQGNQHLPQMPHNPQPVEELLILACQVLTAIPDDGTLLGDLVHVIMYADVSDVPIEKAASYLSTEGINHVIRALETERIEGDFTLAAETLRKLTRERSLQNLSVVSILQAVKGDARIVWSLTELPEPLKELFHIPFQELYKELKK